MRFSKYFQILLILVLSVVSFSGCSKDDDNTSNPVAVESPTFKSISSPYLICANRNPGGVGFDFFIFGAAGGANNLDSVSTTSFVSDITIRTIQAQKVDGGLAGMPFIKLADGVTAVNYSTIDTNCTGINGYNSLNYSASLSALNYQSDNSSFNLASLPVGSTGKILLADLQTEYNKLIIGQRWRTTANNSISGDEIVWIIKTAEGKLVKFIVTCFPANPAPTVSGYIAVEWSLLN